MVAAKLTALCKDAGLIDKKFPMQRVEISFSRLKPKVRGLSRSVCDISCTAFARKMYRLGKQKCTLLLEHDARRWTVGSLHSGNFVLEAATAWPSG